MLTKDQMRAVRPPGRARWGVGFAFVALAVSAPGGCQGGNATTAHHEDEQKTYQQQIDRIELDLDSGNITLTPGDAAKVAVKRALSWDSKKQTVTEKWSGNTLRITTQCAKGEQNCATDYEIEIPPDVTVVAKTQAGNVTTRGIQASQELRSGAGDLTVDGGKGEVKLYTDSGKISGSGLAAGKVEAVTDAGEVTLELTTVPASVSAKSAAGDIDLRVPRPGDGSGYQVQASTDAGNKQVDVESAAGGTHKIVVSTDSGDIKVRYAG